MPTPVKCVFIFRDNSGTGWEEIHYWLSSSSTPALNDRLTNMVNVIAPARALLLGMDTVLIGARASYPRPGAIASLSQKFFLTGNPDKYGVSPAISLAVKFTDTTATRHKVTHLRGFWDAVEINGEYHPEAPGAEGFADRLNDWKSALIAAGYGWMSKDPASSAQGSVTNYVVGEDGRVTLTLGGTGMPLATVDSNQTISFSRINKSTSPLNTQLLCKVTARNTVTTVNQFAAGPFSSPGKFNYRSVTFANYSQVYDVSAGRRAQGRPFGQLPGRGKAIRRY